MTSFAHYRPLSNTDTREVLNMCVIPPDHEVVSMWSSTVECLLPYVHVHAFTKTTHTAHTFLFQILKCMHNNKVVLKTRKSSGGVFRSLIM